MHHLPRRLPVRVAVLVALLVSTMMPALVPTAGAAGFQGAYIRLDRMKINTATGGTICAQPATVATEAKSVVTFPTGYTVNSTASNWDVNVTDIPSGSTAWPGIGTEATNVSAQVVTFSSSDLTVGTLYCFNFVATSTLTTPVGTGTNQQASIESQTSGNARIDYTQIALATIADDQIVVTAVVPPTFSFVLDGNASAFSTNLDPASIVSSGARTITITTNAKGGWIAWAKDTNAGLNSATASHTIAAAAATGGLTIGVEGYAMDVDATTDAAGGCTLAVAAGFNGNATGGGALSTAFQQIASCGGTSPATANGDVITLTERAAIAGSTPAGSDYTDIITVVGAGNF
jgi:hypothetical protein